MTKYYEANISSIEAHISQNDIIVKLICINSMGKPENSVCYTENCVMYMCFCRAFALKVLFIQTNTYLKF